VPAGREPKGKGGCEDNASNSLEPATLQCGHVKLHFLASPEGLENLDARADGLRAEQLIHPALRPRAHTNNRARIRCIPVLRRSLVALPGGVPGLRERAEVLVLQLLAGLVEDLEGLVEALNQRIPVAFAHRPDQRRGGASDPGGVPEGPCCQGGTEWPALVTHHGQGLGENMRQVGDPCYRAVVCARGARDCDSAGGLRHSHHPLEGGEPRTRWFGLSNRPVVGDHPYSAVEKPVEGRAPARMRSARHWVPADEAISHPAILNERLDLTLHTGHIG